MGLRVYGFMGLWVDEFMGLWVDEFMGLTVQALKSWLFSRFGGDRAESRAPGV